MRIKGERTITALAILIGICNVIYSTMPICHIEESFGLHIRWTL